MTEELHQKVGTEFVVTGNNVSRELEKMAHHASLLQRSVEYIEETFRGVATTAGLAVGGFGVEALFESTIETLESVKRIRYATGLAAEKADGLRDAFKSLAGVEGPEAERIMLALSKDGAKVQEAMQNMSGLQSFRSQLLLVGVDIRKGPLQAILDMSKAAEKGWLGSGQLATLFSLRPQMAIDFMEMLKAGPEAIKEAVEEVERAGTAITAKNLAQFAALQHAQRQFAVGWERIKITVGKELLPVLTNILGDMNRRLPEWVSSAQKFAGAVQFGLTEGLSLAKQITKVMLLNAAIQRATAGGMFGEKLKREGEGTGLWGTGKAALKAAFAAPVWAKASAAAPGNLTTYGVGAMFKELAGNFLPIVRGLSGLAKISGVAFLIDRTIVGFKVMLENAGGIRDYLTQSYDRLMAALSPILDVFKAISNTFGPETKLGLFFTNLIPLAISTVMDLVTGLVQLIQTASGFLGSVLSTLMDAITHFFSDPRRRDMDLQSLFNPRELAKTWSQIWQQTGKDIDAAARRRALDRAKAQADAAGKAPEERGGTNFNFYNNRFDITQSFAEGFDPDRIAVATMHGLGGAGVKRLGSNLQFAAVR